MSAILGVLAIGLMVMVLIIAAGSLVIAATIPLGKWLERRREGSDASGDTPRE